VFHAQVRGQFAQVMKSEVFRVVAWSEPQVVIVAPPTLILAIDGNEYLCGYCRTLLLVAKSPELGGAVVHCQNCGRYNTPVQAG
jgi:hypothetical protein